MRRMFLGGCVACLLLINAGCLAVEAKGEISGSVRQAVVLNGEIYLVETDGSAVYKIDRKTIDKAKVLRRRR